jgi:cellulose synthase/poly-beta-1,6-N-acetylglucosamine synthase-like glycosyltransferase
MISFLFWFFSISIIYTYAGYPLLLGLFARLKPKRSPYPAYEPMVTLLIAAYNEEAVIAQKIENSLSLNYPREKLQILIADDGSSDATVAIVRSYAERGVELSQHSQRQGKMGNISSAMKDAKGEIVVMSDANNIYGLNTIQALVAPFQDASVGATGGSKKILQGDGTLGASEGLYWKYESWIKKQETHLGCTTSATGEALAIRRDLFVQPPVGIINDDFYMMMSIIRRGYRMIYVPEVESFERVSLTAADEVERRTRIVAGRYQAIAMMGKLLPFDQPLVIWQVFSHKFIRPLVPFAMMAVFLSNALLVIWPPTPGNSAFLHLAAPWNLIFMGLQLAFYLLAALGSLLPPKTKIARLLYLPTFLVNSNFAALYGLFRYLRGGQSTFWTKVSRRE